MASQDMAQSYGSQAASQAAPQLPFAQRIWTSLDPFHESGGALGRRAANAGLLGALLAADPFAEYRFYTASRTDRTALERTLEANYPHIWDARRFSVRLRLRLPADLASEAERFACLHLSDCLSHQGFACALRNAHVDHARRPESLFPITGTTHSLSRADTAQRLLAMLSPCTTSRDAIICTSHAGRVVVATMLQNLREGLGLDSRDGARCTSPELALIPLGVDTRSCRPPQPAERIAARRRLGVDSRTCVLLAFGRISHHSKMDLLPLLRAMARLLRRGISPRELHLVVAGGLESEDRELPATLRELAGNLGLGFSLTPNPDEPAKRSLFHAADLFVSIPDNPQETFGLTMLEAGAFGLPSVAADYDGYRDLVENGRTGLLVPTIAPPAPELASELGPLSYDNHTHLLLAQQTCVETGPLADALEVFVRSPERRAAMGQAARERVAAQFSWDEVVRLHLELWEELAARPLGPQPPCGRHPLALDYGAVFAGHPSRALTPGSLLSWTRAGQALYRGQEHALIYAGVSPLVDPALLRRLLFAGRRPRAFSELMRELVTAGLDAAAARFLVGWALKHDLLAVRHGSESGASDGSGDCGESGEDYAFE